MDVYDSTVCLLWRGGGSTSLGLPTHRSQPSHQTNTQGGLGTSMGLDKAKSLLTVKGADTFLDLTAKQVG